MSCYNGDDYSDGSYYGSDDELIKCKYCSNKMPRRSIRNHVSRKHFVQCKYCPNEMLPSSLAGHQVKVHAAVLSEIEREREEAYENGRQSVLNSKPIKDPHFNTEKHFNIVRITDQEINNLMSQKRIYAKHGNLYLKNS